VNEAISLPKAIVMGTRVRLRNEAFRDMNVRNWQFSGIEKGKLVLWHPGGLILRVKLEDIDWEVFNKPKNEDWTLSIQKHTFQNLDLRGAFYVHVHLPGKVLQTWNGGSLAARFTAPQAFLKEEGGIKGHQLWSSESRLRLNVAGFFPQPFWPMNTLNHPMVCRLSWSMAKIGHENLTKYIVSG
jgi:hypothetical protein